MKTTTIIFSLLVLFSVSVFAQAPQGISYQAVVRDANGNIIPNQNVSFQFSIIQGNINGNTVYVEQHQTITNQLGMVVLAVGNGTPITGNFANINWQNSPYFLKVEIDVTGGNNYVEMGTTQLLSVPYALFAEKAANAQTYTAGNGIQITGNVITNTAPDQPITLTGQGATTITGTYPNFVISSTDNNTTYSAGTGLTLTGTTFSHNPHTGDVTGTTSLTVTGIQGRAVSSTAPTNNQVLQWNGTNWAPTNPSNLINPGNGLSYSGNTLNSVWTQTGNHIYNNNTGRVGIGLNSPTGKLTVKGDTSNVLFEVLDKDGKQVFVVYQDSVHVFVDASGSKTNKGTFAVNSKAQTKSSITPYLRVTPDSSRVYTEDPNAGFGVRDLSGGNPTSYMNLTPKNYFIGHEAGTQIAPAAQYNLALGFQAAKNLYAGRNNVFIGYKSGFNTQWGWSNIFIGSNTGMMNDFGRYNIYIGDSAGMNPNFGEGNIFIGYKSGFNAGSQYNTFIGTYSGSNTNSYGNTFIGYASGKENTNGYFNTSLGISAGVNNTIGSENCFLGANAGFNNNTGRNNVYVGTFSGTSNIAGNFLSIIGYWADVTTDALYNSTAIGANSVVNISNKMRFGDANIQIIEGNVPFFTGSDLRFKQNIEENIKGLEFITKLRPVTYEFNPQKYNDLVFKNIADSIKQKYLTKASKPFKQIGLIAQEVEKAAKECNFNFYGLHTPENNNDYYSISYEMLTIPLIKAVQELNSLVELQQKRIEQLEKEVQELKSMLNK